MYTPEKTASWEGNAAGLAQREWGAQAPYDGAVRVVVRAVKGRRASDLKAKSPAGRLWRLVKPDVDNVAKAALDALVMAGVLRDDTLVVILHGYSLFAAKNEGPCVEIEVSAVNDGPGDV